MYISLFSRSFSFTLRSAGTAKSKVLLFLLIVIRSGPLAVFRWYVFMSNSQWSLCVSFSTTDSVLCRYHLFVWSNQNFLHNSLWIILPTQSSLVLYYFYANLLHSLIMCLMVSSQSPHHQDLLFCCVLPIFALICLVLMALFCTAIRSDNYNYYYNLLIRVFHISVRW